MNIWITYLIIAAVLVAAELVYFRIADRCNIIDKPNERSSHSSIVLRGGGIIFAISILVWMALQMVNGEWLLVKEYLPFIIGLVLAAGISFIDDIHSLPDSVRLVAQFVAMGLMLYQLRVESVELRDMAWYLQVIMGLAALIVCVGATNVYNFMDGINGITAGYSLAVILPLIVEGSKLKVESGAWFVEPSLMVVVLIGVLVFSWFNFRPKGKAKCFAAIICMKSICGDYSINED